MGAPHVLLRRLLSLLLRSVSVPVLSILVLLSRSLHQELRLCLCRSVLHLRLLILHWHVLLMLWGPHAMQPSHERLQDVSDVL